MDTTGRQRFGHGQRRRGSANSRNRPARFASELQSVVGVQRHRSVPVENAGPVQSIRLPGLHKRRQTIGRRKSRCRWLGKNWFRSDFPHSPIRENSLRNVTTKTFFDPVTKITLTFPKTFSKKIDVIYNIL